MQVKVTQKKGLFDSFSPPPDKSLTHRALLLGGIGSGPSVVSHGLESEDAAATRNALMQFGVKFEREGDAMRVIPVPEWQPPTQPLDCGNSGTTTRLISGLIASRPVTATLIGDPSLSKRPMGRIATPLLLMGAKITGETLPMTIHGSDALTGIAYDSPVASAQIKSCLLLAGLRAHGKTIVTEPSLSRDHTERMLSGLGVRVEQSPSADGRFSASVEPCRDIPSFQFCVPGDISSATFFFVAAVLLNQPVTALNLGVNPTRTGVFEVLAEVGCRVEFSNQRLEMGEPVADVTVSPAGRHSFSIQGELIPRLIDEIPVLAVMATQLEGVSTIRNAGELRVKESDRIEAIAKGIRAMGGRVETFEDGLQVEGPTPLAGATIHAHGDHRIAMAFAIAGLIASGETIIEGAETIATSYPNFMEELGRINP